MFERIVHEPRYQTQYNITALSRPDVAQSNVSSPDPQPNQPWVVMLDNFLSVDEANRLIALGSAIGYERSTDVGVVQTDGSFEKRVSTSRTSTNAWCNTDECESDPTVQSLHRRIEELTNIPSTHSEAFQLLQYEPGQFYGTRFSGYYLPSFLRIGLIVASLCFVFI